MPAHDNAEPWTPGEDQLLEQLLLDPRMRDKNGNMNLGLAVQLFQAKGFTRSNAAIRARRDRFKQGREKAANGESTKLCTKCFQIYAGHICRGPTATAEHAPAPPAPRSTTPMPITPRGNAARTAPAGGTVRPSSPPYGLPVAPPAPPQDEVPPLLLLNSAEVSIVVSSVPSPQRMPSIPLDAMDPSMGTFGTTIAPPDEPMPLVLDVDHLERTRFSPPYDPFASSDGESMFEGRPSFDPSGTPDGSAAGGGWY